MFLVLQSECASKSLIMSVVSFQVESGYRQLVCCMSGFAPIGMSFDVITALESSIYMQAIAYIKVF